MLPNERQMIRPEKLPNAYYALHGIIIRARAMANERASGNDLADLLDAAEMLPRLIASERDETDTFRQYLAEIASKRRCAFVLQRFDEPAPKMW